MSKCGDCGRDVTALHSGGDAAIPAGVDGKGGFCDECAQVAWLVWDGQRKAKIAARVAAKLGGSS